MAKTTKLTVEQQLEKMTKLNASLIKANKALKDQSVVSNLKARPCKMRLAVNSIDETGTFDYMIYQKASNGTAYWVNFDLNEEPDVSKSGIAYYRGYITPVIKQEKSSEESTAAAEKTAEDNF